MFAVANSSWDAGAIALLQKDVRAEARTRVAAGATGAFALSALFLVGLATAKLRGLVAFDAATGATHPAWGAASKFGLLWVILCFAAFAGMSYPFVHEEETGTATALRLTMQPGAVYAGKLAFNTVWIMAVALVVTPLFMLMTGMPAGAPVMFFVVMITGCIGLAGAATIAGALTAKARASGAVYGALGLPSLTVLLALVINAGEAMYGGPLSSIQAIKSVGGLVGYSALLITLSSLTFAYVWED